MPGSTDIDIPGGDQLEEVLAMPGDPADEEPGAERKGADQPHGEAVLRIPLKGLHTAISMIGQTPEK